MKIDIMYDIDAVAKVDARDLGRLIAEGKVLGFRRSSGWIMLGRDVVRGRGGEYGGPERRDIMQRHTSEPHAGLHLCLFPDRE